MATVLKMKMDLKGQGKIKEFEKTEEIQGKVREFDKLSELESFATPQVQDDHLSLCQMLIKKSWNIL